MKRLLFLLLTSLLTMPIAAQTDSNKALRLDGKDNNVRTGIGFLEKTWTLETWLKGDDTEWKDLEVIFGGGEYSRTNRGDFNSCSHLDWTKEAAPIHFGYGPVAFPISAYMLREGYTDSFREVNPDEVARHEGTYAVIFGQLQVSRIDFLYYKGSNIKAVNSKIIKTTPEIDDVWASDHAAVLSEFEVLPTAGN